LSNNNSGGGGGYRENMRQQHEEEDEFELVKEKQRVNQQPPMRGKPSGPGARPATINTQPIK